MKIPNNQKEFAPHPEYTGRAVIVDVTEPKSMETMNGPKIKFRIVFESELMDEEKKAPWCVWSPPLTFTLDERGGFRKFLKGLYGRDLTKDELDNFDTDVLLGMNAFVVIVHASSEDGTKTYANIASCTPWKEGPPKPASGKYVKKADRPKSDYHKTEQPKSGGGAPSPAPEETDYTLTKIHVGRHKGHEMRDVDKEGIQKYVTHWLPAAKANPKPTADDRRFISALEKFVAEEAKEAAAATTKAAEDDCPY